jgi:hypothetical protein
MNEASQISITAKLLYSLQRITAAAIALALDPRIRLSKRVFQDYGTSGFVLLDENRMFINF